MHTDSLAVTDAAGCGTALMQAWSKAERRKQAYSFCYLIIKKQMQSVVRFGVNIREHHVLLSFMSDSLCIPLNEVKQCNLSATHV